MAEAETWTSIVFTYFLLFNVQLTGLWCVGVVQRHDSPRRGILTSQRQDSTIEDAGRVDKAHDLLSLGIEQALERGDPRNFGAQPQVLRGRQDQISRI